VRHLTYLSLGAGVQSSTLALMAAKGELPEQYKPTCAFFADTLSESPVVYQWLDWLETQLPFPVIRVSAGSLEADSLILRTSKAGRRYWKGMTPFFVRKLDGEAGILHRKCTANYKIRPLAKAVRMRMGIDVLKEFRRERRKDRATAQAPALALMGISLDEVTRMKPSRDPVIELAWPLIDMRMRRSGCLAWMARNGYPTPPRSACVFCPYHNKAEWKRLKNEEPAEFARAVEYERQSQLVAAQCEVTDGVPFLTRDLQPLSTIDFDAPNPQMNLFGDGFTAECEGLCGI
jgi:hypothetical protein